MASSDPCDQLLNRTNLRSLENSTHPIHCFMLTEAAQSALCESFYFSDIFHLRRGFQ